MNARTIESDADATKCLEKAISLHLEGRYEETIELLEPVVAFHAHQTPTDTNTSLFAQAAHFLGASYHLTEDEGRAAPFLKQAFDFYLQKVDANNPISLEILLNCAFDLIDCYVASSRLTDAARCLSQVEPVAFIHLKQEKVTHLNPIASNLYLLLAESPEATLSESLAWLEQGITFDPTNAKARMKLALTLIEDEQYDVAVAQLKELSELVDLENEEPPLLADYSYHLARCYFMFNNFPAAINSLLSAIHDYREANNHEGVGAAQLGLAMAYYKSNKLRDGDFYLKQALTSYQQLDSSEDIFAANEIIQGWCALANFPKAFNYTTAEQVLLKDLLARIKILNNLPSSRVVGMFGINNNGTASVGANVSSNVVGLPHP